MEYKARELFAEAGLPVPTGFTVDSIEELEQMEIPVPTVVKAQVETVDAESWAELSLPTPARKRLPTQRTYSEWTSRATSSKSS